MNKFFITATGTNIGKTFVTTNICRELRLSGRKVSVIKPVISGYEENDKNSDTALILESLGLEINKQNIENISPWRFRAPLSPDMAAKKEGKHISLDDLVKFCRSKETDEHDILLAEAVGGVCVPLNDKETVLDWMEALPGWKIILITSNYLGSISHTISALHSLAAYRLKPYAVIINESEDNTVSMADTEATLLNFLPETAIIASIYRNNEIQFKEQKKLLEIFL